MSFLLPYLPILKITLSPLKPHLSCSINPSPRSGSSNFRNLRNQAIKIENQVPHGSTLAVLTLQVPRAHTLSPKSTSHLTAFYRSKRHGNAHCFTLSTRNFHQLPRAHLPGTNPTCQLTFSHNDKRNPNPPRQREHSKRYHYLTLPSSPWPPIPNSQIRSTPPHPP